MKPRQIRVLTNADFHALFGLDPTSPTGLVYKPRGPEWFRASRNPERHADGWNVANAGRQVERFRVTAYGKSYPVAYIHRALGSQAPSHPAPRRARTPRDVMAPEVIRKIFRFDRQTGHVRWVVRTPDVTTILQPGEDLLRRTRLFNQRFAGKPVRFDPTSGSNSPSVAVNFIGASLRDADAKIKPRIVRVRIEIVAAALGVQVEEINMDAGPKRTRTPRDRGARPALRPAWGSLFVYGRRTDRNGLDAVFGSVDEFVQYPKFRGVTEFDVDVLKMMGVLPPTAGERWRKRWNTDHEGQPVTKPVTIGGWQWTPAEIEEAAPARALDEFQAKNPFPGRDMLRVVRYDEAEDIYWVRGTE